MLDLATLFVSMGLQEEMKEVRQESAFVAAAEEAQAPATPEAATALSDAADSTSEILTTVENAVAQAANTLLPSWEMVEEAMPTMENMTLTLDLSLPSSSSSSTSKKA